MAATRVGTHVTCKNPGFLFIGIPARHADRLPALKTVEAFFDSTGVVYRHEEDIERRIWCKWMFNIGVNQTIAVAKGTFADIQKPGPVRDRYIDAMREVVAVAEKVGVDVTERDLEEYIRIGDGLDPEGMPSLSSRHQGAPSDRSRLFSPRSDRKGEGGRRTGTRQRSAEPRNQGY